MIKISKNYIIGILSVFAFLITPLNANAESDCSLPSSWVQGTSGFSNIYFYCNPHHTKTDKLFYICVVPAYQLPIDQQNKGVALASGTYIDSGDIIHNMQTIWWSWTPNTLPATTTEAEVHQLCAGFYKDHAKGGPLK